MLKSIFALLSMLAAKDFIRIPFKISELSNSLFFIVDVICSNNLPTGTAKMINLMKQNISTGVFHPFSGPLTDQEGNIRCDETDFIKPEDIMTMDWLVDNVVGSIPNIDDLTDNAKPVVQLRGLQNTTTDEGGTSLL